MCREAHNLRQFCREIGGFERLVQNDPERMQAVHTVGFGEARDEQFGAQSPDPFSEFGAVHLGHCIIDNGGVEIGPSRQDIERRHSGIGFDDPMSEPLNHGRGHFTNAGVVIDQQYRQRPRRN
jgi:hypothetical protein